MQDPKAQLEEMTRATEQLISFLSAESPERLAVTGKNFLDSLEKQIGRGPLNFSDLPAGSVREEARKDVERLRELTLVALGMAAREQQAIRAALAKSRNVRHFLEATQSSIPNPQADLVRDA